MRSLIQYFVYSAGAILLFLASALFLVNFTIPGDLAPATDPILHVAMSRIFWFVGGIAMMVAMVCLFGRKRAFQAALLLWVAGMLLAGRVLLDLSGANGGFRGYVWELAGAFGIQAGTADQLLIILGLYLLAGSIPTVAIEIGGKAVGKSARD